MQHHQQNHTIPQLQAQPPPPPPPPGMLGPSNGQQQPQSQQPMNVHSGSVMSQAQRPYPQMGMHQQQQQPQQHHLQPSSHQQPQQQYMIHHQQQQQSSHQQQQQQSAGQQQQVMGNVHSYPVYSDHSQQPHQRQHSSAFGQQSAHSNNVMHLYQKLSQSSEKSWSLIGSLAENMGDYDRAIHAYESALRFNPYSVPVLTQLASLYRLRELAVDYFQRVLNIDATNGEIWGALGHSYLMMDELPKAFAAYQQALHHMSNPKEPKLWYGIGILYDRYGSFEHAEEAFTSVLKMDPNFEKSGEIYFRLGIIYKQQTKYDSALQCFQRILKNPPTPLADSDIFFQIGHVLELKKDYVAAKVEYDKVIQTNPNHAKALQQLGWLYQQPGTPFHSVDTAVQLIQKSLDLDSADAQSWYLLGRCYMALQKFNKAYESYQQAVYRDGRNPIFWCSIGVLYYQINQYRDALDAYSRAIRLNPYISEVWYDLGTLYESCNNQLQDAVDAYARAAELDPNNSSLAQRLANLRAQLNNGGQLPDGTTALPPPAAKDINPSTYRPPQAVGNNSTASNIVSGNAPPQPKQQHRQQPQSHAGSTSIPSSQNGSPQSRQQANMQLPRLDNNAVANHPANGDAKSLPGLATTIPGSSSSSVNPTKRNSESPDLPTQANKKGKTEGESPVSLAGHNVDSMESLNIQQQQQLSLDGNGAEQEESEGNGSGSSSRRGSEEY